MTAAFWLFAAAEKVIRDRLAGTFNDLVQAYTLSVEFGQRLAVSFNVTAIRAALAHRATDVATALLGKPNHRLSSKSTADCIFL